MTKRPCNPRTAAPQLTVAELPVTYVLPNKTGDGSISETDIQASMYFDANTKESILSGTGSSIYTSIPSGLPKTTTPAPQNSEAETTFPPQTETGRYVHIPPIPLPTLSPQTGDGTGYTLTAEIRERFYATIGAGFYSGITTYGDDSQALGAGFGYYWLSTRTVAYTAPVGTTWHASTGSITLASENGGFRYSR